MNSIADFFPVKSVLWSGLSPIVNSTCHIEVCSDPSHHCYIPPECAKFLISMGYKECIVEDYYSWEYALRGGFHVGGLKEPTVTFKQISNSTFAEFLKDTE
jgi:hypothetical protein